MSLCLNVGGIVIHTSEDLHGQYHLPDIWGSFPPYWIRTCTETTENNKFTGSNKAWFLSTLIELSITEGGNDYRILLKGTCTRYIC